MVQHPSSFTAVAASLLLILSILSAVLTSTTTEAYAFASSSNRSGSKTRYYSPASSNSNVRRIHRTSHREDGSAVTLYLFPSSPAVSAANRGGGSSSSSPHPRKSSSRSSSSSSSSALPAMSQSVLADCDTIPSFSTAHGLLSPEVVMRIADTNDLEYNGALHKFLKTYKSRGPMACLSMLSDPDVLPELTRAMRDVAM
jgi:hypothetical protein